MAKTCKFYKLQKQRTYDGGVVWNNLDEYQKGDLIEVNSVDCGGGTWETIYKWVTVENETECVGFDLYTVEQQYVSEDNGTTWTIVDGATRAGSIIEANSEDCGYVPFDPSAFEGKVYAKYINGDTYTKECDGNNVSFYNKDFSAATQPSSAITQIIFGNCVYEVGMMSYENLANLKNVQFSQNTREVSWYAFKNCTWLENLTFPSSMFQLEGGSFSYCYSLTEVTVPEGCGMHEDVFGHCINLTAATIPSYNPIGSNNPSAYTGTFEFCTKLETVNFTGDGGIKRLNGVFGRCESLKSVNIPSSVERIDGNCFAYCYALPSIELPESLTYIGDNTFLRCHSLTSITIPMNVTYIGQWAFMECTRLEAIYVEAEIPPTLDTGGTYDGQSLHESMAFDYTNNCPIYVPCNSVDTYKSANGWMKYRDRIQAGTMYDYEQASELDYVCVDTTKHYKEYKVQSTDCGVTWTRVVPTEYITGDVIEYGSLDCGAIDTNKVKLYTSDSETPAITIDCSASTIIDKSEWTSTIAQSSITKVEIGGCANTLGAYAFGGIGSTAQTSITSITIPDNVTTFIGSGQFEGLSKLKSVRLPNSFSGTNNNFAFSGCSSLEEITIPINGKIGQGWCVYCTSLRDVTIGSGCTSIDNAAFGGCPELTAVTINATTPPTLGGSSTNQKVFYQSPAALIYVPDSSVNLYKNDSTWAMYADRIHGISEYPYNEGFKAKAQYSDSISSITCNSSSTLTSDETASIAGNNVKKVTIGSCVTEIGDGCFGNYQFHKKSFTSVTIPNSVTSIGTGAFSNCSGLTKVNIPDSVTSIGDGAFYVCKGLTSINIPSGVTSIGDLTFGSCTSLTSVTIPNGVTSIDVSAFSTCSGLTSIVIPNSVTSIGSGAFQECSGLTSVTISSGITSIPTNCFDNCTSITSIDIPSGVTSIGDYAFRYCNSITSVTIPNSVTSIGDYAFKRKSSASLHVNVMIGSGVTTIGSGAFGNDYSSEHYVITITAETPPTLEGGSGGWFSGVSAIYVPAASVDAYKAATNWSKYANKIQAITQ